MSSSTPQHFLPFETVEYHLLLLPVMQDSDTNLSEDNQENILTNIKAKPTKT